MNKNLNKAAEELLNSDSGAKLASKKDDIQKIADSSDGQKVKAMLEKNGSLSEALEKGDMDSIRKTVSQIMQTEAGARLAQQLSDIIK